MAGNPQSSSWAPAVALRTMLSLQMLFRWACQWQHMNWGNQPFDQLNINISSIIQNGFMNCKDVLIMVVSHCEYIYIIIIYIYYIILKNIDNLGAFGASTQSILYDGCQRESHRQKRGYESKHDIWTGKKFAKIHCLGCSSVHSCLLVQWCQSSQPVVAI